MGGTSLVGPPMEGSGDLAGSFEDMQQAWKSVENAKRERGDSDADSADLNLVLVDDEPYDSGDEGGQGGLGGQRGQGGQRESGQMGPNGEAIVLDAMLTTGMNVRRLRGTTGGGWWHLGRRQGS